MTNFLSAHVTRSGLVAFRTASQLGHQRCQPKALSSARARHYSSQSGGKGDEPLNQHPSGTPKGESSGSSAPGTAGTAREDNLSAYAPPASSSPFPSSSAYSASARHDSPSSSPRDTLTTHPDPRLLPDSTSLSSEEIEALYHSYTGGRTPEEASKNTASPQLTPTTSQPSSSQSTRLDGADLGSATADHASADPVHDKGTTSADNVDHENAPLKADSTPPSPDTTQPDSTPPNIERNPGSLSQQDTQDLINRQLTQIKELRAQLASWTTQASIVARQRADDLTSLTKTRLSQLGRNLNQMTGYDEIDTLKARVVEQEAKIAGVRASARAAKSSYTAAVTALQSSQRQLADLLHRKPSWTSSDVINFTHLVRLDHEHEQELIKAKAELDQSDEVLEREFDELMRRILGRYHEEQVWSDKIRSASTYGQLLVLGVNVLVFLSAIIVVEPWKRRKLAATFERKVEEIRDEGKKGLEEAVKEIRGLLEGVGVPVGAVGSEAATREPFDVGELRNVLREELFAQTSLMAAEDAALAKAELPPPKVRRAALVFDAMEATTELGVLVTSAAAVAIAAGWIARSWLGP